MNWTDIGSTLARIGLPALGTAFGGPLGGVLGNALGGAVADALGVPATPDAVSTALASTDPEIVKAKLADLESARQTELETYKAEIADRQGARTMQVDLSHESSWVANMPSVQTLVNWVLAGGVIVGVGMGWLREDGIIVGFGIGAYTASNNFWLGSSSGSKRSADAVRTIAERATMPSMGQLAGQAIDAVKRVTR